MKVTSITAVGRSIDINYPTNRAIVICTLIVMLGGTIVQLWAGEGWVSSGLWGLNAGLAVFLAWAMCRELDPDHPLSAFVAAGLAMVGVLPAVVCCPPLLPQLTAILWLLVAMRVVNRTSGLSATVLDSLAVLGLGIWLSYPGNWGYGALTVIALVLDGLLPIPRRRQLAFAGVGAVVAGILLALRGALWKNGTPPLWPGLMALGMGATFLPVLVGARSVTSVGDATGDRLHGERVQAAQGVALLAGVQAAFWSGAPGLVAMMPLWAAVVGASIYWGYVKVRGAAD